nr:AAA family ATPase [uncultured Devosia sp.]
MADEIDIDDEDDAPTTPKTQGKMDPISRAVRMGRALPAMVLKRALGKYWNRFYKEEAVCVIILVKSATWVAPFMGAARSMANWQAFIDGDSTPGAMRRAIGEAMQRLSTGDRVIAVFPSTTPVPSNLRMAADIVVEIDGIEAIDIVRAVRLVTKTSIRAKDIRSTEIDMIAAMGAIRSGSTASACLRRLNAPSRPAETDRLVGAAPPIEALHGYGPAMDWAKRLVSDLHRWRAAELDFSAIQRNAILAGLPGTGKSTFVRSLAKSTGLPLITSSVGKMFSSSAGYLDSIIKQLDMLFEEARRAGPACIVFLDELEAFPDRSRLDSRHSSWWTPVVTHMLTLLDGALSTATDRLIVVGATNHPDRLDSALTRPGRMDRVIWIDLPDEIALAGIYRQHLGTDLQDEDLSGIAVFAVGSTGAEAAGHVKGARVRARNTGRAISLQDLIDEICPPSTLSAEEIWRTCVHESGHALAAHVLGTANVMSVAVTGGDDGTAGRVIYQPTASRLTDPEVNRNAVVQMLAGRAAEEVLLGSISSGAGGGWASDLAKASKQIASAHVSLGLRGSLVHLAEPEDALLVARRSPVLMQSIDAELHELYQKAKELVERHSSALLALAEKLRSQRIVSGAEVTEMLEDLGAEGFRHA